MKPVTNILTMVFIMVCTSVLSQTIVLNACHPLIETEDYTFNQKVLDVTGRNTFETNPVDENSPCGGIGNCEFQIAWNATSSRWEILADDGNGTFLNTYVLYYNTEASLPNPPSLTLGTWVEDTNVTESLCGVINSLTGDVQDMTLGVADAEIENAISVYPNPVKQTLFIKHAGANIDAVSFYNVLGELVLKTSNSHAIDVSKLNTGIYFVTFKIDGKEVIRKIVKE